MVYLLIPILIFATDYLIKKRIEKNRIEGESEEILGGRIILHKYHNKGAMLNLMERHQGMVTGISAGITACVLISFLILIGKKGMSLLKVGMGLILGGALSNLFDRIKRKYVVDYFSFQTKWEKLRRIVFNISDICIFLGSAIFIFWNLKNKS